VLALIPASAVLTGLSAARWRRADRAELTVSPGFSTETE
jgi:hypothetical protein